MNIKSAVKLVRNLVIFFYALFVASLYFGLSFRRHHELSDAIASFDLNFPTGSNFIYSYLSFLSELAQKPINLLGLFLGSFPAISGLTLGYDGAGGIYRNNIFQLTGALTMFIYMLSTRSSGTVALISDIYDLCKIRKLRREPENFRREAFKKAVDRYPGFRFNLTSGSSTGDIMNSAEQVEKIIEEINSVRQRQLSKLPLSFGQRNYLRMSQISRIVSLVFFAGAVVTVPVWHKTAKNGWDHIYFGLGQNAILKNVTMLINIIFYAMMGARFFSQVFRDFLGRMLAAMYNPQGSHFANIARLLFVGVFFCGFMYHAWQSGAGMGFEAQNIDLEKEFYGVAQSLTTIYPYLAQLYAGVFVNSTAAASYFVNVLPRFICYSHVQEFLLKRIRARTSSPSHEHQGLIPSLVIDKRDLQRIIRNRLMPEWEGTIAHHESLNKIDGWPLPWYTLRLLDTRVSAHRTIEADTGNGNNVGYQGNAFTKT